MFRDYSWFHRAPENFYVDKRRQKIWRRWAHYYRATSEFKLLQEIEADRESFAIKAMGGRPNPNWLLRYRGRFRQIFAAENSPNRKGGAEAIRYYLASCPREMVPIGIWLIGRCGDRFHSYPLSEFCCRQPAEIRKHVAKALRRLEEWWLLEDLANWYLKDERIQRFAKSAINHRSFRDRLSQYVQAVDDSHAGEVHTPSQMPFWASDDSWERTPPKSVLLIRRILRRIQHWVHWGVN